MKLQELNEAIIASQKQGDSPNISFVSKADEDAVLDVYADAFSKDPMFLWVAGLDKDDPDRKQKMFDLTRYLFAYMHQRVFRKKKVGTVLGIRPSAADPADSGHVGYVTLFPSSQSQHGVLDHLFSLWRYGMPPVYKRGEKEKFGPLAAKRLELLGKIDKARLKHMKGSPRWIYLATIGVSSDHHGQGYGSKLLRMVGSTADSLGVPVYLETESRDLEAMYKHFGFRTVEELVLRVPGDNGHDATHTQILMRRG